MPVSRLSRHLPVLTFLIVVGAAPPGWAQTPATPCANLSGAEEVECLRAALEQTRDALVRAERALQSDGATPEPPAAVATPRDLGAEQAARRSGAPAPQEVPEQRISALVVSSERVHPNRLQVQLENGQVWRQIQGDTQRVELSSRSPVSAEIRRSGFGGYRMRLPELGRVLKVERIR